MTRLSLTVLAVLAVSSACLTAAHPGHEDGLVDTAAIARRFVKRCNKRAVSCVLTPEVTEGPYYYSYEAVPLRKNITEDRAGIPLQLRISVVDVDTCDPVVNAAVDVWHCDGNGIYSHYVAASTNQGAGPMRRRS